MPSFGNFKIKKMRLLNRFWPLIFIFCVWFIFSTPYFIQNKIPFASDYLVNFFSPWSSYSGFAGPVKNNAMPDVIGQIAPWKMFTIDTLKSGQIPFWNPYSFSGTTHLANYQSAVLSPFNLLFFFLPFIDAWSVLVLLQPFLAGIFMFNFLKSIRLKDQASLLGAISFMFCGFLTTWMGYATLGYAILFLPLALFSIEKFYTENKFKYLILFSLTFPLSFFSGHFQISLYFLLFIVLYLLFKLYETKNRQLTFFCFLYLVFGVLLTLPQILPSVEAYAQSLRSSIYQKTEVIPWNYLATFFAPDFFGNPVTRNDWYGHYAEWNAFLGIIPMFLAIYSLFYVKNKKIFFFLTSSLIAIFLSFQTPLLNLIVLLKIPVLSTSAASRIIVLFSFSAAVLAAFGYEKLEKDLKERMLKNLKFFLSVISIIFITLWLIVFLRILGLEKSLIARQNLILPTLLYIGFTSVVVLIVVLKKFTKKRFILLYILILLTSIDMLRFATKWQPFQLKSHFYPNVQVSSELIKIGDKDRALASFGAEAAMVYKVPLTEGYDAVYNKRYGEFLTSLNTGDLTSAARSVVAFPKNGLHSETGLNLLGVNFLIHKKSDDNQPWEYPFWNYPDIFKLNYDDGVYQIFVNSKVFPKAFLVKDYKVESNAQDILNTMFTTNLDLQKTIVVEKNLQSKPSFEKGALNIITYTPNKIEIKTSADGSSLLFLADSFYPGWKAFVDGEETEILRSDFTFRAINLPRGKHLVEFNYFPKYFILGVFLASLSFILMLLFPKFKFLYSKPFFSKIK